MAEEVFLEIKGLDDLNERLTAAFKGVERGALKALREEAELIMTQAKELTPVATGALRASGIVVGPTDDNEVIMGFGGPAVNYAVYVHEMLGVQHPHGGQAKFLEQPVLEAAARLPEMIAARMAGEAMVAAEAGGE